MHDAQQKLEHVILAVEDHIARQFGADRTYRLWRDVESEARDAVAAWSRTPREPADDFERLLDTAREATASFSAAKAAIRAAQGAVIEAGIAKLHRPTDPTKVVARMTGASTGLHFEVTLDAAQVRVLSPNGKLPHSPLAAE